MSIRLRSAACVISCAALLIGPLQAVAGAALPKEEYQCFKKSGSSTIYTYWDLTIVDDRNYEFTKDDSINAGKYRLGKGKKMSFTKGYLKEKGFKGKHFSRSGGGHQIDLIKKGKTKPTYNCAS